MSSSNLQRLALFIFLIFTVWLSFYMIRPPASQPESSPAAEFSAGRAFNHVQQMAKEPHPLGSAANDSVRNYIVDELQKLGLKPTIQKGIGVSGSFGGGLAGHTNNIIAKMDGRDPTNTLLLMSHYDSAPNAPGAADDASGVAAILEAVRAVKSQEQPLKNNVWILITDGEERGLLGAELFVEEFAKLHQIDLVLNFEARGSSGPSMMFETSSPNGKLIPHFAEGTPDPVANSLMSTVYKLLPNDTDLSVTKRADLNGINFAFAKQYLNYHTIQDTPENLSMASLQHHGTNLLGNLRHFGNTDFDLNSTSEYVYFNNATGGLLYYPSSWSFPLAAVAALLFIAYLVFLYRTNQLDFGSYVGSILLFLGVVIVSAAITYFGWQGIKLLHPQYQWLNHGEVYTHSWYLWGFTLLIIALFSSVYGWTWIQKRLTTQQFLAGSYTTWMLLSLGTAWYLPTASYLFTWPVLMALIGWIILGSNLADHTWKSTAILALSLSGVLFMVPPYIHLVQVMLTTEMLAVSMTLLVLVLGLAWPLFCRIFSKNKVVWNSVLAITALGCFIMASAYTGFNVQHKKQNDMNFVQNLDTGQAYWISRDDTTDNWTQQFLGDDYNRGPLPDIQIFGSNLLYKEAKKKDIPSPEFSVVADSSSDSLRHLSLNINPREDGIAVHLDWDKNAGITKIGLQDKTIFNMLSTQKKHSVPSRISYFKDLSEAIKLHIATEKTSEHTELKLTFLKMGLPANLITNYQERKPYMMPSIRWNSNVTAWKTSVNLDTLTTPR